METVTQQEVAEKRVTIFANIAMASRASIKKLSDLPTRQELADAKARFIQVGVMGAVSLMNTILKMESRNHIVGYICFSFKVLTERDMQPEEVEKKQIMKLMHLPCSSFGKRDGSNTALMDMIKLSHNPQLGTLTWRQTTDLSSGFTETSRLLVQATRADCTR